MASPSESGRTTKAEWRSLSFAEQEMLRRLLATEFPGKNELLVQAKSASVKDLDDEGSIALDPGANVPLAGVERRIPVEAEFEDIDGTSVHVLLHVVDGRMNELEIYREDSAPLLSDPTSNDWRILLL
jgi:hypothetical protein